MKNNKNNKQERKEFSELFLPNQNSFLIYKPMLF